MAFIEPHPTDNRGNVTLGSLLLGKALSLTPLGWFGWLVAGAIGNYLFPPKYPTPDKYTDLGMNTAQSNIPVPIVYGTMRVNGNYVWRGALQAVAIETSTGGGGMCASTTQVTGYNYYMRSAMGICEGKVKISRMWKNEEVVPLMNHTNITMYDGSTDQAVDPTIASYVTNPVPYRGLAYASFDEFPLGENQPQAPVFTFEVHNYPWYTDAGDMPFIRNAYSEAISAQADLPPQGIAHKLNNGNVLVTSSTSIKEWDPTLTTEVQSWTIALNLPNAFQRFYDVDVVEDGDGNIDVFFCFTGLNGKVKIQRFRLSDVGTVVAWQPELTNNAFMCRIWHDEQFSWLISNTTPHNLKFWKCTLGNYGDVISTFTVNLTGDYIWNVASNEDYIFVLERDDLHVIDYSGNLVDTSPNSALYVMLCAPWGMKGVYRLGIEETFDGFNYTQESHAEFLSYDSNGQLTSVKIYDEDELWEDGHPPSLGNGGNLSDNADCLLRKCTRCPDGTWLVSWRGSYLGGAFGNILNIILDANPSQVIYDALMNIRGDDPADYVLASIQDVNDFCWEYRLGVSLVLDAKIGVDEFLKNMLQYFHGILFINNEGNYEFKVFRDTDTPIDTLTERDIKVADYEKFNVDIKDRMLLPNRLNLKYIDRCRNYTESSFQADHLLAQTEDGEIIEEGVDLPYLSNADSASVHAYKLLKLMRYDTNGIALDLMPKHLSKNVGDLLNVAFTTEGLEDQNIRLLEIEEPVIGTEEINIPVLARFEKPFFNTYERYPIGKTIRGIQSNQFPLDVRPICVEVPALMLGGGSSDYQLMVTAIVRQEGVAGVDFYVSDAEDGTYYRSARIGNFPYGSELDGDWDRDSNGNYWVDVDTSDFSTTIPSFTLSQQLRDEAFTVIGQLQPDQLDLDNVEMISFSEVTGFGDQLRLKNVHRGLHYTLPQDHNDGDLLLVLGNNFGRQRKWARLGFDKRERGSTVWVKAQPYFANGKRKDLSQINAYSMLFRGYSKDFQYHTSGFELVDPNGNGQGSINTTIWHGAPLQIQFQWNRTNPVGGIDAQAFDEWEWDAYTSGRPDGVNYWSIIIYDSSLTHVVTRSVYTLGDPNYVYTQAQANTDFGYIPSEFYIFVAPRGFDGARSMPWLPLDYWHRLFHVEIK